MNVNRENNIFLLRYVRALIFLCLLICSYLSAIAQPIKIKNNDIFKIKGIQRLSGMVMKNANAFIIAGSTNATFMLSEQGVTHGNEDYYVFETNRTNEIQWEQIYGSRYTDRISSIIKHSDNLIFAGTTWDLGSKKEDIAGMETDVSLGSSTRIIKTDLNGKVKWDNTYKNVKGYSFSYDPILAVKTDGGYVATSQIVNNDTYRKDIRIFSITQNGNMEWDRKWTTDKDKTIVGIVQSDDGGYVLAGGFEAGYVRYSTWIMKLSSTGQLLWNMTVGAATSEYTGSEPRDMIKTKSGNYLVVGQYRGNRTIAAWVVMMGENGNVIWEQQYPVGDDADATCVVETKDGGFVIGGISRKKEQHRVKQSWLIRTNDKGNKLYQVTLEAERSTTIKNIVIIDSKQFAIAGEIDEEAGIGVVPNTDIWFMVVEE